MLDREIVTGGFAAAGKRANGLGGKGAFSLFVYYRVFCGKFSAQKCINHAVGCSALRPNANTRYGNKKDDVKSRLDSVSKGPSSKAADPIGKFNV